MEALSKLAATATCLIALSMCLSGCASMAEGITRALMSNEEAIVVLNVRESDVIPLM